MLHVTALKTLQKKPTPDACCANLTDHAKGHSIDKFLTDCCHPQKGIGFSDQYITLLKWTKKPQLLVEVRQVLVSQSQLSCKSCHMQTMEHIATSRLLNNSSTTILRKLHLQHVAPLIGSFSLHFVAHQLTMRRRPCLHL